MTWQRESCTWWERDGSVPGVNTIIYRKVRVTAQSPFSGVAGYLAHVCEAVGGGGDTLLCCSPGALTKASRRLLSSSPLSYLQEFSLVEWDELVTAEKDVVAEPELWGGRQPRQLQKLRQGGEAQQSPASSGVARKTSFGAATSSVGAGEGTEDKAAWDSCGAPESGLGWDKSHEKRDCGLWSLEEFQRAASLSGPWSWPPKGCSTRAES